MRTYARVVPQVAHLTHRAHKIGGCIVKYYVIVGVRNPEPVSGPWNSKGQANRELRKLSPNLARRKPRVEAR